MVGRRVGVGLGMAVVLAAGLCLRPSFSRLEPSAMRVAELRDRFLVEDVARPLRERLGQTQPPGPPGVPTPGLDRPAAVVPVPFLLPYTFLGPSCVEQVCNLVGSLGCDTDQRILRVLRMCSGNYSGDCVRAACAKLVSVECDTLDAIGPLVTACRSNFSGSCLETACRLLGDVQCQTQQALARILDICSGNIDGSCVTAVCARLGPNACTTLDEIALVAQSCGAYAY